MYACRSHLKSHRLIKPELTKGEVYRLIEKHSFTVKDPDLGEITVTFGNARHLLAFMRIELHKEDCSFELVEDCINEIQTTLNTHKNFLEDCEYQQIPIIKEFECNI